MNKYYRVHEIAKMIDRDKTTIFRWEKDKKIDPPARDSRGWRLYTEEDLNKMKEIIISNLKYTST